MRPSLKAVLMMVLLLLIMILVNPLSARHGAPRPHIVFVLADDLGHGDVGYHGSEIRTPNIDRLASEGVKLENYYVQPICTPTRSQLLSGRYQIHTGLQHGIIWPSMPSGLPLELPSLADTLRSYGYSTHMVGKWHIGFYKKEYTPTFRGFDSYFGYLTGSEMYFTHTTNDPNPAFPEGWKFNGVDLHEGSTVVRNDSGVYSTHLFADKAIEIIENHPVDKPMFLYLPFQAVHSPLQVPDSYTKPYQHIKDYNRRQYAGMLSCLDEAVGNITKALQHHNMWENTVFVFSTDNGGQVKDGGFNYPLRGWKGSLWEGGMKGVGFVHSPLLTHRYTNHELIHVTDWYPTLVSLAGGDPFRIKLDGFNVWPTISAQASSPRTEILHNIDPLYHQRGNCKTKMFKTCVRAAVRVGDWKLITGDPGNGSWVARPDSADKSQLDPSPHSQNIWLFNITADPTEHQDLSHKYPDIVDRLLERLAFYNQSAVPVNYPASDPKADPRLHGDAWIPWLD